MAYLIRFDFASDGIVYAGRYKGGAGFAPTPRTAWRFDTREEAERVLANAYGPNVNAVGEVIEALIDGVERTPDGKIVVQAVRYEQTKRT